MLKMRVLFSCMMHHVNLERYWFIGSFLTRGFLMRLIWGKLFEINCHGRVTVTSLVYPLRNGNWSFLTLVISPLVFSHLFVWSFLPHFHSMLVIVFEDNFMA